MSGPAPGSGDGTTGGPGLRPGANGGGNGRPDPGPDPGEGGGLPSSAAVIGAWAGAVGQLWDITAAWLGLVAEQGYLEVPELEAWSTTVWFPRDPDRDLTLAWSDLRTADGHVIPASQVEVTPTTVPRGRGRQQLQVKVRRPVGDLGHGFLYRFDIWATGDPAPLVHYARGFGVPGAGR